MKVRDRQIAKKLVRVASFKALCQITQVKYRADQWFTIPQGCPNIIELSVESTCEKECFESLFNLNPDTVGVTSAI